MTADDKLLFRVNTSPHIRDGVTTSRIMFTVCLALLPALLWALVVFGWRALVPIVSCVVACVVTEWLCQRWRGQPVTISDGSAVVTGLLLAAVSPSNLPWWSAAVGGIFAIAVVKQAFGGLGHNIWNPALLARAFMQVSMPDRMMSGEWPHLGVAGKWWNNFLYDLGGSFAEISEKLKGIPDAVTNSTMVRVVESASGVDVMTGATALERLRSPLGLEVVDAAGKVTFAAPQAFSPTWSEVLLTWFGVEGGTIGEVSAVLVLLGGLFLIYKKIIKWDIPVFFIATAGILGLVLPHSYIGAEGATCYTAWFQGPWMLHVGAGGLMLGAFFMATDMVTRPLTQKGRIIYAVGCGAMTMVIRLFGGYPEGVCYSILLMNTCVPLIDAMTRPQIFGKRGK